MVFFTHRILGHAQLFFIHNFRAYLGNEGVLAEIQVHLREVYDGTPHCAKEYSHHAYEYYREAYGAAPASAPSSKFEGLHEMKLARVVPPTTGLDASTLVFYAHLNKVVR